MKFLEATEAAIMKNLAREIITAPDPAAVREIAREVEAAKLARVARKIPVTGKIVPNSARCAF